MPRVCWPLQRGRPQIEIVLTSAAANQSVPRTLIADTGAGPHRAPFQFILPEADCLQCGGVLLAVTNLGGAYKGQFRVYGIRIRLPTLRFDESVWAVGVPLVPRGFDGIACVSFLNRFTYGNFGDLKQFGLER